VVNLLGGAGNDLSFEVNGHTYNRYYLLANGVYPRWSYFLRPIHELQDEKKVHFTKMQSVARKDVEHAFGILQARFKIVKNLCRQYELETMSNIMMYCIVLHNMIIQDEQGQNLESNFKQPLGGG
jgi:hypothetical protein